MAWAFGDGFDCYAAPADAINGYWDSATNPASSSLVTGRFPGSRALQVSNISVFVKSSGQNDAVHHLVVAFQTSTAISGTTLMGYLQLVDGTTNQCTIVFRSDGAILLASGAVGGTVLATYAGAFTAINTWYAFEFEVVINNTTGSFKVRKNGNTVDDHSTTGIDTQNSANPYANKLQVAASAAATSQFDDLYWRSDAASVAWMGDIRCYTRAPASDAAVQFSRTPTGVLTQSVTLGTATAAGTSGNAYYTAFTAAYDGTVNSVSVVYNVVGNTTTMKCAIFADTVGGLPGALIASATAVVTPVVSGNNVFTFTGVSVVKGTRYWVGACRDGTGTFTLSSTSQAVGANGTMALASFPQSSPVVSNPSLTPYMSWTYTATPANWQAVSEPQQDATTSYVYDSVVGHADFYGINAIASTPLTTYAVTTRAYAIKSDAGTRTMAVQLKSGASTVASPTVVLTPSNWQWAWRHDTVDPATSAPWTAAAVNVATIGPTVIA